MFSLPQPAGPVGPGQEEEGTMITQGDWTTNCRICGYTLVGYETEMATTFGFNDCQPKPYERHINCDDVPEWHAKQVAAGLHMQAHGIPLMGMPTK